VRIVSLVPSHTESLFELGVGDLVVGRTRYCIFPEEVTALPHVGGTKDASAAKILALKPDLVLADKDENPLALVQELEKSVEVMWSHIETIPDVAAWLERLVDRLDDKRARERLPGFLPEEPAVADAIPIFCPIWHPWMTFNGTAYPSAMLAAAGLRNVFASQTGDKYFEVTSEQAVAAGAKWALLPTEPYPFHKKPVSTAQFTGSTIIDGEALTWFGTRTKRGIEVLKETAALVRSELSAASQQ
jgi:ABC-type Fe3+-hydroxamate transport system substrate-binding protein